MEGQNHTSFVNQSRTNKQTTKERKTADKQQDTAAIAATVAAVAEARSQIHSKTRPLKSVFKFTPGVAQALFRSLAEAQNCATLLKKT